MDAKKCDICGNFYVKRPLSLVEEIIDAANDLILCTTNKDILDRLTSGVDICRDCKNELLKTVKYLKKRENNTEEGADDE